MKPALPRNLEELADDLHQRWSRELRKRRPDWEMLARLHALLAEVDAAQLARGEQGKRP